MDESSPELQSLFLKFVKDYDKGRLLADENRKIIWVNPSACKDLALSENDLIGASLTDSGLPSGPEKELILTTRDNSKIVFNGKTQIITDKGREYSLTSISRKSVIRPLTGAEAELLVTSIPDNHETSDILVWAVDTDYRYLFFNDNHKEAMKMVWNADIEIGAPILGFVTDPDYRLQAEKNYERIFNGEVRSSIDHFTLKSGEHKYYENFGHVLKSNSGEITGIILYTIDITSRTEIDSQLRTSVSLLESIINSPEDVLIFSIDKNYRYLFFNKAHAQAMRKVWGADIQLGDDILGSITDPDYEKKTREFYRRSFNGERITRSSILKYPGGKTIQHENIAQPILGDDGRIAGITVFSLDVTERLNAENALRESLKEKEFLLKEIHHRIKNNFQTISGILGIQKNIISDDSAKQALQDSLTRVNTMGMIHEALYRGNNLRTINMKVYCEALTESLKGLFSGASDIRLEVDVSDIELETDRAIPVGLIINEMITNSFKYAFKESEAGVVRLSLLTDSDGRIRLKVEDNGTGFPKNFDIDNASTLGLKLISAFASQLHGELKFDSGHGLAVEIIF